MVDAGFGNRARARQKEETNDQSYRAEADFVRARSAAGARPGRRRLWRQQRQRRHQDRPPAAGKRDAPLRNQRPSRLRRIGRRTLQRLRSHLQQRRRRRPETAEPGRSGADPGRRSPRRRPDGLQIGGGDRRKGAGPERAGAQLRPPDRKRRSRRLRLLRQRKSRRTAGRNAGEKTERRRQRQRPDHHDQRRPGRPQRRAVQSRRPQRVRSRRGRRREGVRHARAGPPKTPSARRSRRSPRSATTASPASTPPTTTPAAAPSRR